MSMKLAVLGMLVDRGPGYAYDVACRFEDAMGPTFEPNRGGVYQALDALERDALVEGSYHEGDVASPRRRRTGPRIVYGPTVQGVEAYERWIDTPAKLTPMRSQLALKVALSRPEHGPALLRLFDDYEKECLERLREHSAASGEHGAPQSDVWRLSLSVVARARATRLLNAEIEWVRDLREAVLTLLTRPPGGQGP